MIRCVRLWTGEDQNSLKLGFVSEAEFDPVVDPKKMVNPYVATGTAG
jgi:hypothetical protein